MMVVKCTCCNKKIEVHARFLKTCRKCSEPVCPSCRLDGYCKDCHPANTDTRMVYDYFKDKYMEKARAMLPVMIFFSLLILILPVVDAEEYHKGDNYLKIYPTTSYSPVGENEQVAYIYSDEDRTLNCGFEFESPISPMYIERKVSETYDSPTYHENCVEEDRGNGTIEYCESIYNGVEELQREVWSSVGHLFNTYNIDGKYQYIVPSFPLKEDKEEVIRWGYKTDDLIGKYDLYCWNGTINDYKIPSWSMRLDPFFNTSYLYKVPVNASVGQGSTRQNYTLYFEFNASHLPNFDWVNECGGVRSDNSTVKFVNATDDGELYHFVHLCDSTDEILQVYFRSTLNITTSSSLQGYIYYGLTDSSALTVGDIDNTFIFADDFDDASFDTNKWDCGSLTCTEAGGIVNATDSTGADYIQSKDSYSLSGRRLEAQFKFWNGGGNVQHTYMDEAQREGIRFIGLENGASDIYRAIGGVGADIGNHAMDTPHLFYMAVINTTNEGVACGADNSSISCTSGLSKTETVNVSAYVGGTGVNYIGYDYVYLMDNHNALYTINTGTLETSQITTTLSVGMRDEDYDVLTSPIGEGEDFYIEGNWTFDANSTVINDSFGNCNYTADDIISEQYQSGALNTSVCLSGCDYSVREKTFTGLHTEGYTHDELRFRLCRDTPATDSTFTIANNCSASYTYDYNILPTCSSGYVNLTIIDANCSSSPSVVLNITSSAPTSTKQLVMIQDFMGIDRLHNESEELVFNSSLQSWISEEKHEYYIHGSKSINISCFYNASGVENETTSLSITVVNSPPLLFIDTIDEWFSGEVSFTNGVGMKYPLLDNITIYGGCADDDLFNAGVNLSFDNGTGISSDVFAAVGGIVPAMVGYANTSFLTTDEYLNASSGYTFCGYCNDTSANITILCKNFTAENLVPTASWTNTSPVLIPSVPATLNFTCNDPEGENSVYHITSNGSNYTGYGSGIIFNETTETTYNLSLICEDSFHNSSQSDVLLTYTQECIVDIISPCDACRYQDDLVPLQFNCSNGVTPTSCWYSVNNFANVSLSNCSATINMTSELGWNRLTVSTLAGASYSELEMNYWAKDQDASVFDFPVLIFSILAVLALLMIAGITRLGVFYVMTGIGMLVVGFQLIALTWWIGALFMIGSVVFSLVMVLKD